MNTETVSEKPRRGRPPSFLPEADAAVLVIWQGDINNRRTLRNKQYMSVGLGAIRPDDKPNERHGWFAGEGKGYRQAVLVELGRIADAFGDAIALTMADKLANMVGAGEVSTTREAAACLRRARLSLTGKPSQASAAALEDLIVTTIINYVSEHPDASSALVQEALCGACTVAEAMESTNQADK